MKVIDRILKVIWMINGVILLVICLFGLVILLDNVFERGNGYSGTDDGLVVTDEPDSELDDNNTQSKTFQGLEYSAPTRFHHTSIQYITVRPKTYKAEKGVALGGMGYSSSRDYNTSNYMNIIFLDKDYQVLKILVDKNATIKRMQNPGSVTDEKGNYIDTMMTHIAYQIGFEDTNEDGLLNDEDHHDVYVSDIDGKNLTQVTSGLDVTDFDFDNANSDLFITYQKTHPEHNNYIQNHFAVYNIDKGELTYLTDISNTLDQLYKNLNP